MKFKSSQYSVLIVGIIALFSCARLPVYEISHDDLNNAGEFNPLTTFYDKKENVNIGISDDTDNFYVQTIFHNHESLMKIMRGGLMIYFDPQGKKGKDYKLKIERSENRQLGYGLQNSQMRNKPGNRQENLSSLIALVYNKVTWDKEGKEFVFYRNLLKEPIDIELGPNKENELQLNIRIPRKELPFSKEQKLFSLGIESGSLSTGQTRNGMEGGGMREGGMRPGGGMSSGRGPGPGMGNGGGMRQGGGSPAGMNPIRIWLQVEF